MWMFTRTSSVIVYHSPMTSNGYHFYTVLSIMKASISVLIPLSRYYIRLHVVVSFHLTRGSLIINIYRPDLEYYNQQSEISSPGKFASLLDVFPRDIQELCDVI